MSSKTQGRSVIQRLSHDSSHSPTGPTVLRTTVVHKALDLLLNVHYAINASHEPSSTREVLYTTSNRRIIDGLLDLISLEGIYPSLLPGVGIPVERRVQSILKNGVVTRPVGYEEGNDFRDSALLVEIAGRLREISENKADGLWPALEDRILVDLVALLYQLAYGTGDSQQSSNDYVVFLKCLLDEYASPFIITALYNSSVKKEHTHFDLPSKYAECL